MLRARPDSSRRLGSTANRRILVLCYGNIYRSAFVAEYLRSKAKIPAEVRSAGFHPVAGRPSPPRHIEMCREFDVELEYHRSSIIVPADLEWADVIVIMDRKNWVQVRRTGARQNKLVWLGALDTVGRVEISDPYRMDDADARRLLARLHACAKILADRVSAGP